MHKNRFVRCYACDKPTQFFLPHNRLMFQFPIFQNTPNVPSLVTQSAPRGPAEPFSGPHFSEQISNVYGLTLYDATYQTSSDQTQPTTLPPAEQFPDTFFAEQISNVYGVPFCDATYPTSSYQTRSTPLSPTEHIPDVYFAEQISNVFGEPFLDATCQPPSYAESNPTAILSPPSNIRQLLEAAKVSPVVAFDPLPEPLFHQRERIPVDSASIPTSTITPALMMVLQEMEPEGIQKMGLPALANRYNVSLQSLQYHIYTDGTITPTEQAKLDMTPMPLTKKVSVDLLRKINAMGPNGILMAGGLHTLAQEHKVGLSSLKKHIKTNAEYTPLGNAKINALIQPHTKRVTVDLLRKLEAMGSDGIRKAGGLYALAQRCQVSPHSLMTYMHANASLSKKGQAMINAVASPGKK
ncbi:hypothetical protein ACVBEF_05380 [Glaciimonas sp. GG7]